MDGSCTRAASGSANEDVDAAATAGGSGPEGSAGMGGGAEMVADPPTVEPSPEIVPLEPPKPLRARFLEAEPIGGPEVFQPFVLDGDVLYHLGDGLRVFDTSGGTPVLVGQYLVNAHGLLLKKEGDVVTAFFKDSTAFPNDQATAPPDPLLSGRVMRFAVGDPTAIERTADIWIPSTITSVRSVEDGVFVTTEQGVGSVDLSVTPPTFTQLLDFDFGDDGIVTRVVIDESQIFVEMFRGSTADDFHYTLDQIRLTGSGASATAEYGASLALATGSQTASRAPFHLSDGRLWILTAAELRAFDPDSLELLGGASVNGAATAAFTTDRAYVASAESLNIFDISEAQPVELGQVAIDIRPRSVQPLPSDALLITGITSDRSRHQALRMDLGDPSAPTLATSIEFGPPVDSEGLSTLAYRDLFVLPGDERAAFVVRNEIRSNKGQCWQQDAGAPYFRRDAGIQWLDVSNGGLATAGFDAIHYDDHLDFALAAEAEDRLYAVAPNEVVLSAPSNAEWSADRNPHAGILFDDPATVVAAGDHLMRLHRSPDAVPDRIEIVSATAPAALPPLARFEVSYGALCGADFKYLATGFGNEVAAIAVLDEWLAQVRVFVVDLSDPTAPSFAEHTTPITNRVLRIEGNDLLTYETAPPDAGTVQRYELSLDAVTPTQTLEAASGFLLAEDGIVFRRDGLWYAIDTDPDVEPSLLGSTQADPLFVNVERGRYLARLESSAEVGWFAFDEGTALSSVAIDDALPVPRLLPGSHSGALFFGKGTTGSTVESWYNRFFATLLTGMETDSIGAPRSLELFDYNTLEGIVVGETLIAPGRSEGVALIRDDGGTLSVEQRPTQGRRCSQPVQVSDAVVCAGTIRVDP